MAAGGAATCGWMRKGVVAHNAFLKWSLEKTLVGQKVWQHLMECICSLITIFIISFSMEMQH